MFINHQPPCCLNQPGFDIGREVQAKANPDRSISTQLTTIMHYRNGREAQNGDRVVQLESTTGKPKAVGQLRNATPGNDFCNGQIVVTGDSDYGPAVVVGACLCDCLHVDDVAAMLAEKSLDKRPPGK